MLREKEGSRGYGGSVVSDLMGNHTMNVGDFL